MARRRWTSHLTSACRWYREPGIGDEPPPSAEDVELAGRWSFGAPTIAGSEEGRTLFYKLCLAREGKTGNFFPARSPQHPKQPAFWILQRLFADLRDLKPSEALPLYAVRLGDFLLATVPGEPTSWAAFDMETAVREASAAESVSILGYCGDYGGYYTTEKEYRAQHYEGSSMLYGRNASEHVKARLLEMIGQPPGKAAPEVPVDFETVSDRSVFHPEEKLTRQVPPRPCLRRKGSRITVRWRMDPKTRVIFAHGPWVVLERQNADGTWEPVKSMGREFDDTCQPIAIRRVKKQLWISRILSLFGGKPYGIWSASLDLSGLPHSGALRVHVRERGGFGGFEVAAPPG